MQIELRSIFSEIRSLKPRSIALVYRNLKSWEEWEDGKKVLREKLEGGAEKFSAELVKMGIGSVLVSREKIHDDAAEIAKCDMCVVTGEPFYSLITIGNDIRKAGYEGPLFLEITPGEAEQSRNASIAVKNAERNSATDLLANFVYLTKKRGDTMAIDFPLSKLGDDPSIPVVPKVFVEGRSRSVFLTKTERNPEARRKCIQAHGAQCALCGFDFSKRFGSQGEGLIHVHHLNQISESKGERTVDPLKDLLPICPNCHFFIHSRRPQYSQEEVLMLLNSNAETAAIQQTMATEP